MQYIQVTHKNNAYRPYAPVLEQPLCEHCKRHPDDLKNDRHNRCAGYNYDYNNVSLQVSDVRPRSECHIYSHKHDRHNRCASTVRVVIVTSKTIGTTVVRVIITTVIFS